MALTAFNPAFDLVRIGAEADAPRDTASCQERGFLALVQGER
jgi:hypothetical protein